jgi:hypothetical protein
MSAPSKPTATVSSKEAPRPGPNATRKPLAPQGAPDARRRAAVVLEVLAGSRTTSEAARLLGVTLPRYYAIEARAVEGLVMACESKRRGPGRSLERELEAIRRENARLERECARSQAIARAAQRTLGLGPPTPPEKKIASDRDGNSPSGKKRRERRPVARALRAAAALGASGPKAAAATPTIASPSAASGGRSE